MARAVGGLDTKGMHLYGDVSHRGKMHGCLICLWRSLLRRRTSWYCTLRAMSHVAIFTLKDMN